MPLKHTDDNRLTWAALLGHWTKFAQASLALPTQGEGGRWRSAVPSVIALQAITHALGELHRVDPIDRPAALDRAGVGIRDHAGTLSGLWGSDPLPESIIELMDDARGALEAAGTIGIQWVLEPDQSGEGDPVFAHAGAFADELARVAPADLELFLPAAGIPMRPGAVVGTIRRTHAGAIDDELIEAIEDWLGQQAQPLRRIDDRPVAQVYRQFDFAQGGPVRDVVAPACGEPLAGQPLLVPVLLGGKPCPLSLPPRAPVEVGELPVEDRLGLDEES